MKPIPRDPAPENTLALFRDPYRFIGARCQRFGTDVFETRLLMQNTICMTGPQAAERFYDTACFLRHGAAPEGLMATLFGRGAVQSLDGAPHRWRKSLFLQLLQPDALRDLATRVGREWDRAARDWPPGKDIALYDAAQDVLTRAVCAWAGVPLPAAAVRARKRQLVSLFDDAARGLGRHMRARVNRHLAQAWLARHILQVRRGELAPASGSALRLIAEHPDHEGNLLTPSVAAAELLNVLRPVIAVSVFVTFAAHALHRHPRCAEVLRADDTDFLPCFLNEVRRYYPFFPAVAARVRRPFEWNGYAFAQGRRVLLDLYGTNHDPRTWTDPQRFDPQRFRSHAPGPFDFIPQGGGDAAQGHRCPGETTTMVIMAASLDFLLHRLRYQVAPGDTDIDMRRLPALPRNGLVLRVSSTGQGS